MVLYSKFCRAVIFLNFLKKFNIGHDEANFSFSPVCKSPLTQLPLFRVLQLPITLSNMSSHLVRNPGIPLDLEWVGRTRVNLPAVKRRADTLKTRRSVKKQWQAAWLLRAVTCIDLTTLSGDDTATNVSRLCFKAQNPVRKDLLESMGMADKGITTGAICVYPSRVPDAVKTLENLNSKVPIASVAAGFPAGDQQNEIIETAS